MNFRVNCDIFHWAFKFLVKTSYKKFYKYINIHIQINIPMLHITHITSYRHSGFILF